MRTQDHVVRRGTKRTAAFGVGVALMMVMGAGALAAGIVNSPDMGAGVSFDEVVDAESGAQYLTETIEQFLPPGEVTGTFEFAMAPLAEVVAFQRVLGIVEPAWETSKVEKVIVLTWDPSSDVAFEVPRPRPGVDTPAVRADLFVIIIEPAAGLELRALTSSEAFGQVATSATGKQAMELVVGLP